MRVIAIGPILAIAIAATGCVGTQQIAYDRAFAQLDAARSTARDRVDGAARETAEGGLATLAGEAKAAARKAREDDRLADSIALFRIAASAAWKSHRVDTISVAREGQTVCRALAEKAKERETPPPRDCLFLELVQPLSVIEQRGDQIHSFDQRIHAVRRLPVDQRKKLADEAKLWADEIISYTRQLDAIRVRIENPEYARWLAPEMLLYVNRQVHIGFCHGVKAAAAFDHPELRDYSILIKRDLESAKLRETLAKRLGKPPENADICRGM